MKKTYIKFVEDYYDCDGNNVIDILAFNGDVNVDKIRNRVNELIEEWHNLYDAPSEFEYLCEMLHKEYDFEVLDDVYEINY